MKLLNVVGSSSAGRTALVERLVSRLSERGKVATVIWGEQPLQDTPAGDSYRNADAAVTYEVCDNGEWVATGENRSLTDTLASLAPTYDYTLIEGHRETDIGTVALAGCEHEGQTVVSAPDAESVNLDNVIDWLEDQDSFETLESLVAEVKQSEHSEYAGAIATFTGRVRTKEHPDDTPTEYLEFERYDDVAEEKLAGIKDTLEARDGVYEVRFHHKTGIVHQEEDIVFVVVLAGHRSEAFETVEDGINRLKEEVPLFKKEVTVDEHFWAHEQKQHD